MKNLKRKILNNKLVSKLYLGKFYLNLFLGQIGWFTGKLPELMSLLYLSEKLFNTTITLQQTVIFGILFVVVSILGGYFLKHSGLYDVEVIVNAKKNAYSEEVYKAAKLINERFK